MVYLFVSWSIPSLVSQHLNGTNVWCWHDNCIVCVLCMGLYYMRLRNPNHLQVLIQFQYSVDHPAQSDQCHQQHYQEWEEWHLWGVDNIHYATMHCYWSCAHPQDMYIDMDSTTAKCNSFLPLSLNLSCLHAILASLMDQESSQTVPQLLLQISTHLSIKVVGPISPPDVSLSACRLSMCIG